MSATQYIWMGILLSGLSGICLVGLVVGIGMLYARKPAYRKRRRKICISAEFYYEFKENYQRTENIRETLDIMRELYPKKMYAKRIKAAISYLERSHYRDYETALYRYLLDDRQVASSILSEVLLEDMLKRRRLPDKEAERNTYEKN